MPYIGNQGSIAGFVNQPSKQDLTGATGGTLTLTHAVSGPEDISLFINNVRQEPTESYTVTNTTVTLQGYTVSATDDIYVLYNGLTQLSSVPVDGSVSTAKIVNNAITEAKLATSLDMQNITLKGGTTDAITIDSSGRVNLGVPVHGHFYQNAAAAGLGSVATLVKLTLDSTYEQSGGFSLASNEVTVPLTGRYRWSVAIALDITAGRRAMSFALYKNGSIDGQNTFTHFACPYVSGTTHHMFTASNTINCTAGDDVSLYLREYDNNNASVRVYHFAMDFIG